MIAKLSETHIGRCMEIIRGVKQKMLEQNIQQWDDVYPVEGDIRKDIQNEHAFGYFEGDKLYAYIALNENYDPEYDALQWLTDDKALIVHRLSVDPVMQGKGIAKQLMVFAEEYACENGYRSIRLDAFPHNPAALRVYDKLEYIHTGTVTFRKGEFYCYEKVIF